MPIPRMNAQIFYGPGDLRLEEREIPQPAPGEVVARVVNALTCGTEVKAMQRGHSGIIPPVPFGHEWAGVITAVGEGVTRFAQGMRVASANSAPCGACFYCKVGRQSLCEDLVFLWGAYAEYLRIPARVVSINLYELPRNLGFEDSALLEPLSCVVHGIERSRIRLGDTVAINGAGPIGLMFCQLAKVKGARVIVSDVAKPRLEAALAAGADHVVKASGDQVEDVRRLTEHHRGVDVAIEASGVPQVWERTIAMLRPGGAANLFGGPPTGTVISVPAHRLHYEEISIGAVFHHVPWSVRAAFELISSGTISAATYVSDHVGLAELNSALDRMAAGEVIKIAVHPDAV